MAAPIKGGYLDTPLGQLHYYYAAPADPAAYAADPVKKYPVLLMHMSASSAKSMVALMGRLTAMGFSCYAPDMPGFGLSFDPPVHPPALSWYASLYYEALTTQLPGQPFAGGCHIIGHHSGGIIGLELSSHPANRYAGLAVHSLTIVGACVMTAADRAEMSKTFLEPFNKPVASGEHLVKTWDYLAWEGLSRDKDLDLMQREAIDHIRAWKGRNQIYSCVWAYERMAAIDSIPASCRVAGLCARDDVLWPFFGNFSSMTTRPVVATEIKGGNFGPDLDADGIVDAFVKLNA